MRLVRSQKQPQQLTAKNKNKKAFQNILLSTNGNFWTLLSELHREDQKKHVLQVGFRGSSRNEVITWTHEMCAELVYLSVKRQRAKI